jgi:hypothetical protein
VRIQILRNYGIQANINVLWGLGLYESLKYVPPWPEVTEAYSMYGTI